MPPPSIVNAADAQALPPAPGWRDAVLRRPRRPGVEPSGLMLVASDPRVIAAARDAARRLSGPHPVQIVPAAEALLRLVGPGAPPRHLVLQREDAGDALLTAARDPFLDTGVVVVAEAGQPVPAGLRAAPAEGARLAEALAATPGGLQPAARDAAALAGGLARGEITVRLQPMVRLSDRRPILVEALARWERPGLALGAGAFVALAESAGLGTTLTLAVARRALADLAATPGGRRLGLTFNVPLGVLLRPDLPALLRPILAGAGLRPRHLLLELTESTEVRDVAALERALRRLGRAGLGVLLDDLALDDPRLRLLDLPFAGAKLDRTLTAALPADRRARAQVEAVAARIASGGRLLVAEGVTDTHLWRAAASAGCTAAQGFGVGRPVPAGSLPAWTAAWSGSGRAAACAPGQPDQASR